MSPAVKNKLQNFLIVLLSVTAALLFLQNRRLTQGDGSLLSRLFADPGTTVSDSMDQPEIAALPLRFAASGDYAACGSLGMTTAELPPEEKNRISHRARALEIFYEKLKEAGYADK